MEFGFSLQTIIVGILIFFARVLDVSLGTVRTISIVHGRTKTAFFLGLFEISLWLAVIATVLTLIAREPLLGVFYAFGFSTGNVVGIILERRLAMGHMAIRVISPRHGKAIAEKIRHSGRGVTTFHGEGMSGPVTLLYIVCLRKELNQILGIVREIEPDAFYLLEHAGTVSRLYRPMAGEPTGWRAILKRK